MDIILGILSFAVLFGGYAIKRLNDTVTGYSKSYGKEIAKVDATTSRLDEIHAQLSQSVKISESIKSDIAHGAWRNREIELLKREKLEHYLLNLYQVQEELTVKMRNSYFYEENDLDELAVSKLSMLQSLYFPELEEVHKKFLSAVTEFNEWYILGMQEQMAEKRKGIAKPVISEAHMAGYTKMLENLSRAKSLVENKATELSAKINVA